MSLNETDTRLTFKKSERLKSRKKIQSLFIQNQHIKVYPFKIVWLINEDIQHPPLQIGVSASKRQFKLAVDRNFIKRRMREVLRLNKKNIQQIAISKNIQLSFMLIYIGNNIIPYKDFDSKIKLLLIRLGEKINNL